MRISIRSFWPLVAPLTIAVCAVFAAQTFANIVEQEALADSTEAYATQLPKSVPETKPAVARSKSGAAIVERNMFCKSCTRSAVADAKSAVSDRTQLPLRLIATNLASRAQDSFDVPQLGRASRLDVIHPTSYDIPRSFENQSRL